MTHVILSIAGVRYPRVWCFVSRGVAIASPTFIINANANYPKTLGTRRAKADGFFSVAHLQSPQLHKVSEQAERASLVQTSTPTPHHRWYL